MRRKKCSGASSHPTVGHLRVIVGHLRFTIGHIRVTIGHPRVTIGHPRVIMGHLRLTIGYLEANTTELHPKVRQTCDEYETEYHHCARNMELVEKLGVSASESVIETDI